MQHLPSDVLWIIFNYCDGNDTFLQNSLICKQFYKTIFCSPRYQVFNFAPQKNLIALLMQRQAQQILVFELGDASKLPSAAVHKIVEQCQHLQVLRLHNAKQVKELHIPQQPCAELRILDLTRCSSLKHLHLASKMPNLTHFILDDCEGYENLPSAIFLQFPVLQYASFKRNMWFTDADVEGGAQFWSQVTHLNLHGCKGVKDLSCQILATTCKQLLHLNLDFCDITDVGLDALKRKEQMQSLCELSLTGCAKLTQASAPVLTSHANLQQLSLSRCTKLFSPELFDQLAMSCPSLRILNLAFLNIDDQGVALLCARLCNLQHLVLSFCKFVTDTSLQHIAKTLACQSLQVLDISNTTRISDSGLQLFVKHCDASKCTLKRMIVSHAGPALTDKGVAQVRKVFAMLVVVK